MSKLTTEEVQRLVATLQAIVADRLLLSDVDDAVRLELLMAAGRLSRYIVVAAFA